MNGARRKAKKAKKVVDEGNDYLRYDALPRSSHAHYHEELEWPNEHEELDWPTDIADDNRHTFDHDFMDIGHEYEFEPLHYSERPRHYDRKLVDRYNLRDEEER